jgi:hypothetical protein
VELLIAADKNENARACHVHIEMVQRQPPREMVTARFAGIRGSTELMEDLDP